MCIDSWENNENNINKEAPRQLMSFFFLLNGVRFIYFRT